MRRHELTRPIGSVAVVAALALLPLAGCDANSSGPSIVDDDGLTSGPGVIDSGDETAVDTPLDTPIDTVIDEPIDTAIDEPIDTVIDEPIVPQEPGRSVHRMTVAQLGASLPIITNGLDWVEDFGAGPQDMLMALAATLGAPDYVLVVEENLEPSLIIAKFMQDAANRVCAKWMVRDRELPAAERTLIAHDDWDSLDEADVKHSIRKLELRFFSRWVPEDDDAAVADLYELFVAASSAAPAGKEADDGWLGVCMAMMTDPEFVLY